MFFDVFALTITLQTITPNHVSVQALQPITNTASANERLVKAKSDGSISSSAQIGRASCRERV